MNFLCSLAFHCDAKQLAFGTGEHMSATCRCFLLFVLTGLMTGGQPPKVVNALIKPALLTQDSQPDELSDEEAKSIKIADRFFSILEKSPRRGTALERVYGHHVEFGSLDTFLEGLQDRTRKDPEDGTAWMLLGMFEAHRGEDAEAVDAFANAEKFRIDDAMPSYYMGQSLLLIGQPENAVAAFERAIDRKPRRPDMLEIFRQLGRVHQRAQRTEEALKVWDRLEKLFPDDARVQEQIAITMVEEGEYELALPRYEKLATLVKDDYRRVTFNVEAAELKIRLSKRDEGIADLEKLLDNLNPTGWLFRDVRRRIEDVFLRSGDQDGLVKYYEKWIKKNPEDIGAIARLARFLASSARVEEASQWMEKALTLAPKRTDLRRSFIDQLVNDQRYTEASQQYAELVKSAPGNPDFLRDWGKLVMKDRGVEMAKRKDQAMKIWSRIVDARPNDALTHAQVADLYRQSGMETAAIERYEKAVELAPGEPQYREYLGEYLHILKRSEEALKTWEAIAAGDRKTAENVARLAEVYNSFGYLPEAVEKIALACELEPKEFTLQLRAAEYHMRESKYDDALVYNDKANELAASDEESELALKNRIEIFQTNRKLDEEIDRLRSLAENSENQSVDQWHTLARYLEADRDWPLATEALEKALAIDEKSIPVLTTSARIAETSGDYGRAATENRKLAEIDRRLRSEHLMNVARLEAQLGNRDEALEAGRELIVSAPGNTDNYEFFSQLCYRLGETEKGLDALRKAVRINPTEPALTMSLGRALADEFRTDEAIEVYWRAFEKSEEIDDKTTLIQKLTPLYNQQNQFDKLLERLERDRREESKRREMTICLAQAHNSAGDYGTARRELESLLTNNTKDTNLLQQLSKLCESGSDLAAAVEYQKQLSKIAPGHESEFRLAKLLFSNGQRDAASEIFVKLTAREENPVRLLKSVDGLLRRGNPDSVVKITEPLVSESRDNWELLYREAVALAKLEKTDEAQLRFERILSVNLPHDKMGVVAEEKFNRAQKKAKSNNNQGIRSKIPERQSGFQIARNQADAAKRAAGLEENYYGGNQLPPLWTPSHYGVARMAAMAWIKRFESDAEVEKEFVDSDTEANEKPDDDLDDEESDPPSFTDAFVEKGQQKDARIDEVYDWLYVESLDNNYPQIYEIARRLAIDGGKAEQEFFLSSLPLRAVDREAVSNGAEQSVDDKEPMSEADIELMLKCYESVAKDDDNFNDQYANGQVVFSGGRMYIRVGNTWHSPSDGAVSLTQVVKELKLAGKEELAEQMVEEKVNAAKKPGQLIGAMQMMISQKKTDRLEEYFDKWKKAAAEEIELAPIKTTRRGSSAKKYSANQTARATQVFRGWTGPLAKEEENAKVLSIFNDLLDVEIKERVKIRKQADASRRRRSSRSSNQYYDTSIPYQYGEEQSQVNVDYPRAGNYLSNTGIHSLRQVYEVLKRNEVDEDLLSLLQERVKQAEADAPETLPYEQMLLATLKFWQDERDEAVELFREVASQVKNDPSFQFEIANLYEKLGELDESLSIIEAIEPREQKLVQQKETKVLQLAERLGDIDRARTAAERLFGLRLNSQTQLSLVAKMKRLGMVEMADAIVARAQRRSGQKIPAMASLMGLYQGQGKTELANQVAHRILQRTRSSVSQAAAMNRNRRYGYSRNSDDSHRRSAISTLQQTGAINDLIARLEEQQKRSPDSPMIYEQLIEFYMTMNDKDKLVPLLETAVKARPKSSWFREQLAKQYSAQGKKEEACQQYAAAIRENPSILSDDYYEIKQFFQAADQMNELLKILQEINLRDFGQPYYIANFASELLRQSQNAETESMSEEEKKTHEITENAAYRLAERVFDQFPDYRSYIIQNFQNEQIWKNKRLFKLARRSIIPARSQVKADPWFGLNSISSYQGDGNVNSMFHNIFQGIEGTDQEAELCDAIRKSVEKKPGWNAGKVMLAMFDVRNDREEEAKNALKELFADEKVMGSVKGDSAWLVAQELEKFPETREIAFSLLEKAAEKTDVNGNQIQYSPAGKLITLYVDRDEKEKARDLLLEAVKKDTHQNYDRQYQLYQQGETAKWVSEKLLELSYPADAVSILQGMINDKELLQATQYYGSNEISQINSLYANAIEKALAKADSEDIASKIIMVREKPRSGEGVLDLQVGIAGDNRNREPLYYQVVNGQTVPYYGEESSQPPIVESKLFGLIDTICKKDSGKDLLSKRLEAIQQDNPKDKTVAIAKTWFQINHRKDESLGAVESLLKLVKEAPLDEIREGRRPNSRQRRQAMQHLALWPIAQKCLESKDDALKTVGRQFGDLAIEGAMRQTDKAYGHHMLFDWGTLSAKNKNLEEAEAHWTRLLEDVTKRPTRKKKKQPNVLPGMPGAVPLQLKAPSTGSSNLPKRSWRSVGLSRQREAASFGDAAWLIGANAFSRYGLSLTTLVQAPAVAPTRVRQSQQKSTGSQQGGPAPSLIPPLTNSQFQIAHQVALAAADNDMVSLSKRAMREILKGGLPVSDPNFNDNNSNNGPRRIVYSATGTRTTPPGNATNASAYGRHVINILDAWEKKEKAYDPAEVYEMVVGKVFPENRDDEIILYENSGSISSASVSGLAHTLVAWAAKADRLDDLQSRIDQRAGKPRSAVAALVMTGLVAIEREDIESTKTVLQKLASKVSEQPAPRDISLACHVAIPAYTADESLREPCIEIYRKKISTDKNPSLGKLSSRVNRYLAKTGGEAEVRKFFENYLIAQQQRYARHGGDYGVYQMQRALYRAAADVAGSNLPELALEYIGRGTDIKAHDYGDNTITGWEKLSRLIRAYPAGKRYELLKDWTLPKPDRQTIRFAATFDAPEGTELADFRKSDIGELPESSIPGLHCSFFDLIESAQQAGKIDDLKAAVDSLELKKYPDAWPLKVCMAVMSDDPAATEMVRDYLNVSQRDKDDPTPNQKTDSWCKWLVFRLGVQGSEELGEACAKYRTEAASNHDGETSPMINRDFERFRARALKATVQPGTMEPLKHWMSKYHRPVDNGEVNPWTVYDNRQLTYLGSQGGEYFWMKYPLKGNFEFSCEFLSNRQSNANFGGALVKRPSDGVASIYSISDTNDNVTRRIKKKYEYGRFTKLKIEVEDGVMKRYIAGELVYEEKLSGTWPWLTISTSSDGKTAWRNATFEGEPVIASEVPLVVGDRIDGWKTGNETQFMFRKNAEPKPKDKDGNEVEQKEIKPEKYDWHAKDGVLYAKAYEKAGEKSDSIASYRRPMTSGDRFSFEFRYEPGKTMANPVIGSVVVGLLDGQKVSEMVAYDKELSETANVANISDSPHALEAVTLKKDAWNKVDLRVTDSDAEIVVNDVAVWRRPLDKLDHLFPGVQKFKPQAAEIRNVVLAGNWPESLPDSALGDIFESDRSLEDVDRVLVAEVIGDQFKTTELAQLYDKDQPQPTGEDRYRILKDWVLPGNGHEFRFDHLTPSDVLRTDDDFAKQVDVEIQCPAWDLVTLAKEVGKTDQLAQEINALKVPESNTEKGYHQVMAIRALHAIASEDDEKAREYLNNIYTAVKAEEALAKEKKRQKNISSNDRLAIGVATWYATDRSKLLDCATSLQTVTTGSLTGPILARIEKRSSSNSLDDRKASLAQWNAVPKKWPSTGAHSGQWRLLSNGILDRLPGQESRLYFQSPLSGKFEITADVTRQQGNTCWLDFGGYSIIPQGKNNSVIINGNSTNQRAKRKPQNLHSVLNYRIAVDDKVVETYVNNVRVGRHEFKHAPRPWLTIHARSAGSRPIVQNLRITGQPEIPSEIDLLAADGPFWSATISKDGQAGNAYAQSLPVGYSYSSPSFQQYGHQPGVGDAWSVNEGELTAGSLTEYSEEGKYFDESWIHYARPMLEDGEFEFEMFAEKKTRKLCHLSIGRTALLLKEDGIWTQDIVHGSDIDPATEKIADSKGVELKDGDWNRVLLKLVGDEAILSVNDKELATFNVADAKALRYPGLFRFSDRSNAQVRNVKLRGTWQTSLPAVEQQELALNSTNPLDDAVNGESKVYSLARSIDELKAEGLTIVGEKQIESNGAGLKVKARKNSNKPDWPEVSAKANSTADFDVSVDCSDVKITNVTGWGSNVDLEVWFDDVENSAITVGLRRDKDDKLFLLAQREYNQPNGERGYHGAQLHEPFEAGTLRLVRRDGRVYCVAGAEGETQKVITSFTVGGKTASKFSVVAKSATDTSELDCVLKQLKVKLAEQH